MNLSITTPFTHGPDVTKVQQLLKQKGWLQGAVDGIYGPDTARAVYRGKYWLGYASANCNQHAGDLFYAFLSGATPLTHDMQARVQHRKAAANAQPLRERMFHEAQKWVGTKENPPDSNIVMFSQWYGITGPWCAMFVTYCGVAAGSHAFVRGSRWAYVPYIVHDAEAGANGLSVTYSPQQGDLVTFDWNGDGIADHVGLFDHWINSTQFATIEGNTSGANDSNGGEVMARNDRFKSNVQKFVHVGI